jgi:hypothetical protein
MSRAKVFIVLRILIYFGGGSATGAFDPRSSARRNTRSAEATVSTHTKPVAYPPTMSLVSVLAVRTTLRRDIA